MKKRINELMDLMDKNDLDIIICTLSENILALTGYWTLTGLTALIVFKNGSLTLIAPISEEKFIKEQNVDKVEFFKYGSIIDEYPIVSINKIIKKYIERRVKKIGMELDYDTVTPTGWAGEARIFLNKVKNYIVGYNPGVLFSDVTFELDKTRSIKTIEEVERIILANEIAGFGIEAFKKNVVPGNSAVKISTEVEKAIIEFGTGYKGNKIARGWANIFVGSDTYNARLEGYSNNKVIKKDELAFIELGVVADGFWSDLTRVFCAGKPGKEIKEIHKIVNDAYMACEKKIKNDVPAKEVDRIARDFITENDYGENFVHHTGHGLGFKFHEPIPKITPFSDDVLKEGMIIAVEPGIYIKDTMGLRIENNILVEKNNCKRLSLSDFSL
ncbi:M24 family metallopeptidase [Actinomycetota bacterium]